MEHIGIDLGGRESQICVRSSEGKIIEERRWPTSQLGKYLEKRPPSRVILETCAEAFDVADVAQRLGHEVRVVPAKLVRTLGVGARGVKTDRRDAQVLSEVSCRIDLPSVHIPSLRARNLRALTNSRHCLIKARTLLINSVRGWLRKQVLRPRSGGTATFPKRVRQLLERHPNGMPVHIEHELSIIDSLNEKVLALSTEIEALAKDDEVCRRLMSVPGVGPITAIGFVTAIDDISRFPSAHQLASYIGLTPGEHSSSDRVRRTGITKAGCERLRTLLIEAAWRLFRTRPEEPAVVWARAIELRRGKFIAVVALARKLAGILFAMWRDGSLYNPKLATGKEGDLAPAR